MPPIEMTMSPVDDKICIEIPKKYRSYSFAVTLVPVKRSASEIHAVAHKMTLVTRNVRDMEGMGAALLNPFASDKTI